MKFQVSKIPVKWISIVVILLVAGTAWGFRANWYPETKSWFETQLSSTLDKSKKDKDHQEEDGHDHDHDGHDESNSLELSAQARGNIGLTDDKLRPVELKLFTRMMNFPAQVVEKPGQTKIQVGAPMTGVVTAIHLVQGESIKPGTLIVKIRLTHADLVVVQTEYLKTLGELDVEIREIKRLVPLDERGVIAGSKLLERQYSKQKLEAALSAYRQALLLHGLSSSQIDEIKETRKLIRDLEVRTPALVSHESMADGSSYSIQPVSLGTPQKKKKKKSPLLLVSSIKVQKGAMVNAGDLLCELVELSNLYIEGQAFEHDADEITFAAQKQSKNIPGWGVKAIREDNNRELKMIENLKIAYVGNEVDTISRALRFYVELPNQIVHDTTTPDGHRFITWKFKPGQRMQLNVPVEQWEKRFVVPVDAVAQDGAEQYVFQQNGDHFDRRPIQVEYRDQFFVVIKNDGSIFPGDVIALTGAHQMKMALKNKAGGGVDAHAGHNH